jgi:hypothetical protein
MRRLTTAIVGLLSTLSIFSSTLLAQIEPEVVESKEAWVVSYALVVLSIGLGVYIISKPARRER